MSRKDKALALGGLGLVFLAATINYLRHANIPVLQPKGQVADKEFHLIVIAVLLSAIVVLPVFGMLIGFAWKYRESNHKAKYDPHFSHSRKLETAWWVIPSAIILVLSVITWNSSHALDPYKPLSSKVQPIAIQVVALDWKWLFIYPNSNVASVNLIDIPLNTPINFEITSDAPMNSFWIPALAGQVYAMPGMTTQLHVIANQVGSYEGRSANISGDGFAGMRFTVQAVSWDNFQSWLQTLGQSSLSLNQNAYSMLARPSQNNPVTCYSQVSPTLFGSIVNKYMAPGGSVRGMGM